MKSTSKSLTLLVFLTMIVGLGVLGCKKKKGGGGSTPPPADEVEVVDEDATAEEGESENGSSQPEDKNSSTKAERQAWNIYSKLNGVPPTKKNVQDITGLIKDGKLRDAALSAIDNGFYDSVLRSMWSPFTNEPQSRRSVLNDYLATVIGIVRDDIPFDRLLWDDIVYVYGSNYIPEGADGDEAVFVERSLKDNLHYSRADLYGASPAKGLIRKKQSDITYLPADATAGVFTTQTYGEAFFLDGTNRLGLRFAALAFQCRDMEQLHDTTRPDDRIRQDVNRAPTGNPKIFMTKCKGCHSGMDPLAGAFAYFNYTVEDGFIYNPAEIPEKYFRGSSTFPDGYVTVDDSWVNYWTEGSNANMQWHGRKSGTGAKSFGRMWSSTGSFAICMAERVLKEICGTENKALVKQLANNFSAGGRNNFKHLAADAALTCRHD